MKRAKLQDINDVWEALVSGSYIGQEQVYVIDVRGAVAADIDPRWARGEDLAVYGQSAGKWAPPRFEFRGRASKRSILSVEIGPAGGGPRKAASRRGLVRHDVVINIYTVTPQVMELGVE